MSRPAYIRQRARLLTEELKGKLCDMVAKSSTIEEAAGTLDVSLRTVQRERKIDEHFDHEVRLALQAPPNPKKLMETAARTHWRAAAWLLERTEPEKYARRPVNSTSPMPVRHALQFLIEAALQATPPEQHAALYAALAPAADQAFASCFPNMNQWGTAKNRTLPATPLAFQQKIKYHLATCQQVHDRDEQGNILYAPPEETASLLPASMTELPPSTVGSVLAPTSPNSRLEADQPANPHSQEPTSEEAEPIESGTEQVGASPHPTPKQLTAAERLQRQQELTRWGLQLLERARMKEAERQAALLSRKTRKTTASKRRRRAG